MSSSWSEAERGAARASCEELFLDFHRAIDEGRATEAFAVFSEDPEPRFEARGQVYAGATALRDFLAAREQNRARQTRHLATNFRFALISEERARASANLTLFERGEADELRLEAVIDCELEFVCHGSEGWRTASRRHTRFGTVRH